jgi:hypothetical protein
MSFFSFLNAGRHVPSSRPPVIVFSKLPNWRIEGTTGKSALSLCASPQEIIRLFNEQKATLDLDLSSPQGYLHLF